MLPSDSCHFYEYTHIFNCFKRNLLAMGIRDCQRSLYHLVVPSELYVMLLPPWVGCQFLVPHNEIKELQEIRILSLTLKWRLIYRVWFVSDLLVDDWEGGWWLLLWSSKEIKRYLCLGWYCSNVLFDNINLRTSKILAWTISEAVTSQYLSRAIYSHIHTDQVMGCWWIRRHCGSGIAREYKWI
jgi:hypothetical protein